jgi:hypothetical protein
VIDNSANPCPSDDPSIICPEAAPVACPDNASAGSADFTKFVALGTSYTAGFQAGALYNEGQNNSLAKILATQFQCVGGGAFNQPSINSENGFNIFITPNPAGTAVFGRFKLQGTPPQPAPVSSGTIPNSDAVPNPQVNPGFMYTGSTGAVPVNQLNNFSVPAIFMGQALIAETGNWTLAGTDPRFSPFYARFASNPGVSRLIEDAASSVANGGTFVLLWVGMDDALLHAAYGGDGTRAPLTSLAAFQGQFDLVVGALLGNPNIKGVIANFPNPFLMPHFRAVPWNAIPLDAATAGTLTTNLANNYNAFLDGMVATARITAEEAALRKLTYAAGQNGILMKDETLTDLTPYMQGPYAGLQPYAQARQTKSTDIIPLSAGTVLGDEVAPNQIMGVSVPVADQYVLIPTESQGILTRLAEFNAYVKTVAEKEAYASRVAFADINAGMQNLVTAQAGISNGLTITPNINPPTGIYSEDGLHPNSRGYAFIANMFIDAINAKFGASVPKANLGNYSATALPINP